MLNKIQFQTKQIKKFIFTIIIIACNSMVNAQDANEMIENGEIQVVGAMYEVASGKVSFFD